MTKKLSSPIRPVDDEARALARSLIAEARFGALGVLEPGSGAPMGSRVAIGTGPKGEVVTLISSLSNHTKALRENSTASVLLGEPEDKGDPLTHPRITLMCAARFIEHSDVAYAPMAAHYLETHPKSKLYIGFGDFVFVVFEVQRAYLNGGFGKAYELTARDLGQV